MKNKSHPWSMCVMEKFTTTWKEEQDWRLEDYKHPNHLGFYESKQVANLLNKAPMYILCAFSKENTMNTMNGMNHPFREIVKGHEIESMLRR